MNGLLFTSSLACLPVLLYYGMLLGRPFVLDVAHSFEALSGDAKSFFNHGLRYSKAWFTICSAVGLRSVTISCGLGAVGA